MFRALSKSYFSTWISLALIFSSWLREPLHQLIPRISCSFVWYDLTISNSFNFSQPQTPLFKGENYDFGVPLMFVFHCCFYFDPTLTLVMELVIVCILYLLYWPLCDVTTNADCIYVCVCSKMIVCIWSFFDDVWMLL